MSVSTAAGDHGWFGSEATAESVWWATAWPDVDQPARAKMMAKARKRA